MLLWIVGRVGHHPRASVYETQKSTFLQTGLFIVIVCCDQNYSELLADINLRRQHTSMTAGSFSFRCWNVFGSGRDRVDKRQSNQIIFILKLIRHHKNIIKFKSLPHFVDWTLLNLVKKLLHWTGPASLQVHWDVLAGWTHLLCVFVCVRASGRRWRSWNTSGPWRTWRRSWCPETWTSEPSSVRTSSPPCSKVPRTRQLWNVCERFWAEPSRAKLLEQFTQILWLVGSRRHSVHFLPFRSL